MSIIHIEATSRKLMIEHKEIFLSQENYAIISIVDLDNELVFPSNARYLVDGFDRVISLKFSDIEPSPFLKREWLKQTDAFMNTWQANKIVRFIRDLAHSEKEWKLFVHCAAGICRSGAVAQFAQPFSTMKDVHFACVNMQIRPNLWVFNKLIEVWMEEFKDLKTIQPEEEW